jgi:glycosyltransferase involved in cell wall biosynthesis
MAKALNDLVADKTLSGSDSHKLIMSSTLLELNEQFSTILRVIKTQPVIENYPDDKVQSTLFLPENSSRKAEGGLRTQGYFKQNELDKPLVSVITAVFNGEIYLEQTIRSVIEQSYDNVEYIIIDGGSTDGTLDIIRKYDSQVDYWVSEPDKGISDAFNKGISLCTGEIIGIINADDWYEIEAVSEVIVNFVNFNSDIIYGSVQCCKENKINILKKGDHNLLHKYMSICHVAIFVKHDIYRKNGLFLLDFRCGMDYEWLLRVKKTGIRFFNTHKKLANIRAGGVSDTQWQRVNLEWAMAKSLHLGHPYIHGLYYLFRIIKGTIRRWLDKIGLNQVTRMYRKLTQNGYN